MSDDLTPERLGEIAYETDVPDATNDEYWQAVARRVAAEVLRDPAGWATALGLPRMVAQCSGCGGVLRIGLLGHSEDCLMGWDLPPIQDAPGVHVESSPCLQCGQARGHLPWCPIVLASYAYRTHK